MLSPDLRFNQLEQWLRNLPGLTIDNIQPASSDASFRRYFRILAADSTFIVMDAPPPQENVRPFIAIAGQLRTAGINAPEILAADEEHGFLLLTDLGSVNYLDALEESTADGLYGDALAALLVMQSGIPRQTPDLPAYDGQRLFMEMEIFREWFLGKLLDIDLEPSETGLLDRTWKILVESAMEQPRVFVHRDYHSRNLMVREPRNPGVLDFQDAVIGPLTYDCASLLRDCYIAWPRNRTDKWLEDYRVRLLEQGLLATDDTPRFRTWFDLMGMQRHLKAIGIFSRLKIRDGKHGYIKDIPRTLNYVMEISAVYPELHEFGHFLDRHALQQRVKEAMT